MVETMAAITNGTITSAEETAHMVSFTTIAVETTTATAEVNTSLTRDMAIPRLGTNVQNMKVGGISLLLATMIRTVVVGNMKIIALAIIQAHNYRDEQPSHPSTVYSSSRRGDNSHDGSRRNDRSSYGSQTSSHRSSQPVGGRWLGQRL